MNPPLLDETWVRSGISLLWDAPQLNAICTADKIISVRRFLTLSERDWPESELNLVNGRTMVVAGIEACIDAVSPDSAIGWLESVLYRAMLSFQQRVADGGAEAGLVLWVASDKRLVHQASDDTYHWHCGPQFVGTTIPLGRCLWNGAQHSVRRIHVRKPSGEEHAGMFLQRIS